MVKVGDCWGVEVDHGRSALVEAGVININNHHIYDIHISYRHLVMLPWMRQEPQLSFPSSILLEFPLIDANLNTNAFQYEQTLSVFDGLTLQTLRKLSQAREACLHQSARKSGADLHVLEQRYADTMCVLWVYLCVSHRQCIHAHTGYSSTLQAWIVTSTRCVGPCGHCVYTMHSTTQPTPALPPNTHTSRAGV